MAVSVKLARCLISWQLLAARDWNTKLWSRHDLFRNLNCFITRNRLLSFSIIAVWTYDRVIHVRREMTKCWPQLPAQSRASYDFRWSCSKFCPGDIENLQGWRLCDLSGQLITLLSNSGKKPSIPFVWTSHFSLCPLSPILLLCTSMKSLASTQ